jgi:hypothetical protein
MSNNNGFPWGPAAVGGVAVGMLALYFNSQRQADKAAADAAARAQQEKLDRLEERLEQSASSPPAGTSGSSGTQGSSGGSLADKIAGLGGSLFGFSDSETGLLGQTLSLFGI